MATQALPKGRYWFDVFEDQKTAFDAWLNTMRTMGIAKATHVEQFPGRQFVIVELSAAAVYPMAEFGLPPANEAPMSIQSSDDTVKRPDFEPEPEDLVPSVVGITTGVGIGLGLLGIGLIWALSRR